MLPYERHQTYSSNRQIVLVRSPGPLPRRNSQEFKQCAVIESSRDQRQQHEQLAVYSEISNATKPASIPEVWLNMPLEVILNALDAQKCV
eukprot:4766339-Pleurochrysis_carterae.AAC.1